MSWICKECETENPDSLTVCEVCGASMPISKEIGKETNLNEHLNRFENDEALREAARREWINWRWYR